MMDIHAAVLGLADATATEIVVAVVFDVMIMLQI